VYRRSLVLASLALLGLAVPTQGAHAPAGGDFAIWHAYNLKFKQKSKSLLASIYVMNLASTDFRDLTFTARAPEGLDLALAPQEIQESMRRPEGFSQSLTGNVYRMEQAFLGRGQATTIFYEISFEGRPNEVVFPGLSVEYKAGGELRRFRSIDETFSLKEYSRFSGDLSAFIKMRTDLTLELETAGEPREWSFSALDSRAFGSNPSGIIEVDATSNGTGHFRLQSGYPGDLREILVRWEANKRGRKEPVTERLARERLDRMIRWLGDLRVDAGTIEASEIRFARVPTVLLEGRWVDNQPHRLGSGLFRFYTLNDTRGRDFFIFLGVQARGVGPGRSEVPQDDKERELMQQLSELASSFRS
jgi:hypothetical protein